MTTTDPTLSPTDPDGARSDTGAGTGTRGTRIIGIATIVVDGVAGRLRSRVLARGS